MDINDVGDGIANWLFSILGDSWANLRLEEHPALPPNDVSGPWVAASVTPSRAVLDTFGGTGERAGTLKIVMAVPYSNFRELNTALDATLDGLVAVGTAPDWPPGVECIDEIESTSDTEEFDFEMAAGNWRTVQITATLKWFRE